MMIANCHAREGRQALAQRLAGTAAGGSTATAEEQQLVPHISRPAETTAATTCPADRGRSGRWGAHAARIVARDGSNVHAQL